MFSKSFFLRVPTQVAQWLACQTHDLVVVSLIPAYFRLSPLQKHVRKVVGGFRKKSCVSAGVRKPGNTYVIDRHDKTLAVKVALNPNTTNQPKALSNSSLCGEGFIMKAIMQILRSGSVIEVQRKKCKFPLTKQRFPK